MLDAKCTNYHVYRFSYGDSFLLQVPVIFRAFDRNILVAKSHAREYIQGFPGLPVLFVFTKTLQDLNQYNITDQNKFIFKQIVESVGLPGVDSIEIIDPD
jgi:hypothetical protein